MVTAIARPWAIDASQAVLAVPMANPVNAQEAVRAHKVRPARWIADMSEFPFRRLPPPLIPVFRGGRRRSLVMSPEFDQGVNPRWSGGGVAVVRCLGNSAGGDSTR